MIRESVLLTLFVAFVHSTIPVEDGVWHYIPRAVVVDPTSHTANYPEISKPTHSRPRKLVEEYPRTTVPNCGQAPLAPPANDRIVGGNEATPHEYPWQAALFINRLYFCGGTVISDEWVMTAGHCLHNANHVRIILGAHNITDLQEPTQQSYISPEFFTHENYSSTTIHHDIAMARLPEKIIFNDYIQPACLPAPPDLGAGIIVTATGWGKTKDGIFQGISDDLEEVDVPTEDNQVCRDYYGAIIVTDAHICIDSSGGQGPCSGDSGGPLNYKVPTGTEVRGITSFGSSAGCESGAPDAFTRVTHYLDWIYNTTGVTY